MPSFDYEKKYSYPCGVDEAGRGPLAGPVVAAAVLFPKLSLSIDLFSLINDSKKLSEAKRELVYEKLRASDAIIGVGLATVEEIDQINILQASLLAMTRAIDQLCASVLPDMALIDGNKSPKITIPTLPIVKGDSKSYSIAAASIVAKVERDRMMADYAAQYPQYEFDKHKGYPTALHLEKVSTFGLLPIHRKTFGPCKGKALNPKFT